LKSNVTIWHATVSREAEGYGSVNRCDGVCRTVWGMSDSMGYVGQYGVCRTVNGILELLLEFKQ